MSTAHVLHDLQMKSFGAKLARVTAIRDVLQHKDLGFTVRAYGDEYVDEELATNMETQVNASDGKLAAYADHVFHALKDRVKKGDVIIATEPFHSRVFRGLLAADNGRFCGVPVIEMWVNHSDVFSDNALFCSPFTLGACSARFDPRSEWKRNWVLTKPYVKGCGVEQKGVLFIDQNPHDFSFLYHMADGAVVVAPDWGVWHDLIEHGKTGCLYRTNGGMSAAQQLAVGEMDPTSIIKTVRAEFNLEEAVYDFADYMEQLRANA